MREPENDGARSLIAACLAFDPFEGDDAGAGASDSILADRIAIARKQHVCTHCGEAIAHGTPYRARREVYDGSFTQYKWCAGCCESMIEWMDEGNWEPYEARRRGL